MQFNPKALVFWIFTTGIGYLVQHTTIGIVAGLVIGIGISLITSAL